MLFFYLWDQWHIERYLTHNHIMSLISFRGGKEMQETISILEKRLLNTREKIRTIRRDITGGVVEDKVKELGKKGYDELDRDLGALHKMVVDGKAKATEAGSKIYDELEADISAARIKLKEKRNEITGGVGETKAREAAKIIKEKGEVVLREIEEDIGKVSDKLKKAQNSE